MSFAEIGTILERKVEVPGSLYGCIRFERDFLGREAREICTSV